MNLEVIGISYFQFANSLLHIFENCNLVKIFTCEFAKSVTMEIKLCFAAFKSNAKYQYNLKTLTRIKIKKRYLLQPLINMSRV